MVRGFFADRKLGQLLGKASFGQQDGLHFVAFEYLQPVSLEARGVDWLDSDMTTLVRGGHGTYWECSPWILASGCFSESDSDLSFGEREFHKVTGVYMTPQFDAWAGHYSWPCNVFGNRAFYGIGFKVVCSDKYLKRVFYHPHKSTTEERIYEPRGCVITHVVVSYNRSICQGYSRARYFHPRCEFVHGHQPIIRKYPNVRVSVWSDFPEKPSEEAYERPREVPIDDTHEYAVWAVLEGPMDDAVETKSEVVSHTCQEDEIGDYDFEPSPGDVSDSSSVESDEDNRDDGDYDPQENMSVPSSRTPSLVHASDYDVAVHEFGLLENQWHWEKDEVSKMELYKQIEDAEMSYALEYGIYHDIVTGQQTERAIAKQKTRNRMRTRLKNHRCIGLPVHGRATQSKKIKVRRERVDPATRAVITWKDFQNRNADISVAERWSRWKMLPRRKKAAQVRCFEGQPFSWSTCITRYRDYYEMGALYVWFVQLPKMS